MSFSLKIEKKKDYLHAIVTGQNTPENVAGYLDAVVEACKSANCRRLLVEERLEGDRLATMEVFRIASEGSARSFGTLRAVAYVDENGEGDRMQFAETVAVNRGMPVRFFEAVADAEKWLRRSG